jgi:hypothetical protein
MTPAHTVLGVRFDKVTNNEDNINDHHEDAGN